jgi:hypothetical protein
MRALVKARATALLAAILAPGACLAAVETDSLLKSLARPAPATTPFVEVRYSKLLDQPIVVKGQLEYLEDGALVRSVSTPFQERTEIRGETVSVQRQGKSPRKFSLKRAPELRSMLGGFAAVLGGGRSTLEKDFNIESSGETSQWTITLMPKAAQAGKYVRDIVIQGAQSEPRCIVVTQPDNEASYMLVGTATETTLPTPLPRDWLVTFCASSKS